MNIFALEEPVTAHEPMDDDAILTRAATDPQAFEVLYSRYVQRVYRYLYARVGDAADAEDLTSQTFLSVLESLPRYQARGQFAAWLFQIARNRAADAFRRNHRAPVAELYEEAALAPGPAVALLDREEARRLQAALAQLDNNERELLRLRFAAGLTFEQTATVLGRTPSAVKMATYRLIERLQREWEVEND